MSDIDFDELDKAVNSLVGDSPSAEKKDQQSVPAPKAAETIEKPQTTSTPSLPSRRAGRFMDMKHDSSDMKKSVGSSMMNSKNNNLQPLNADVKPDEKPTTDKQSAKASVPDPITSQTLESQNDDQVSAGNNTDIPDSSQKKDEPGIKFEETDLKKDDNKSDDTDDDKKPSPFIDDAKVEKRPLGGFATETSSEGPKAEDDKDKNNKDAKKDDEKKEPKEGEEESVAPPAPIELPPELDKDLVAIEAGEAPENLKTEEPTPEPEESNKSSKKDDKYDDNKDTEAKDEKESKKDHKDEVSQLLATAAGGSIPDQYKRENRSHELHTPHPLFDADHHKDAPVNAPKKPKSKLVVILNWIFISTGILLGGASMGAAVFYLTSQ